MPLSIGLSACASWNSQRQCFGTRNARKNRIVRDVKSYYVAMRTRTSPYCDYRDQPRCAESRLFALISLKIQLNYFAIAARPSSVPVSDMHEIRNSRSVTCLPRLLVAYARSITSKYTAIRTSGSSTNWYNVRILTTTLTLSIRPAVAAAFVKSVNTVLDKLCDKKRRCLPRVDYLFDVFQMEAPRTM